MTAPFATELGGAQGSTTLATAYDIYDRDIDEQEACMFDPDSGAFIYWDEFERFVSVGGSTDFCKSATPYPADIRRHYFLEGMKPQVDPDESDKIYSLLAVD